MNIVLNKLEDIDFDDKESKSIFGEILTEEPTVITAGDFIYGNSAARFNEYTTGAATITSSNSNIVLTSTGSDEALMYSKNIVKYLPGIGIRARFTSLHTGPESLVGIGTILTNALDSGYFIGYRNNQFGFHHLNKGVWKDYLLSLDDPSKGNIWQISIQWLGYGVVKLQKANDNGIFITQVLIHNPGLLDKPHIVSPNFRMVYYTNDGIAKGASYNIMIEGNQNTIEKKYTTSDSFLKSSVGTSEVELVSFREKATFGGVNNFSKAILDTLNLVATTTATRNAIIRIRRNSVLTAPVWTSMGTSSILEIDTAGSGFTTTDIIWETFITTDRPERINMTPWEISLSQGEYITITAELLSNTSDVAISCIFEELI